MMREGGRHADGERAGDSRWLGLDEVNQKIIQALVQRGRSTMRELADTVGRTESTVRERVASLELRGIVTGYSARVDWGQVGLPLMVVIEGCCPPGRLGEMAQHLNNVPNLVSAVVTTGSPNVVAIVRARDVDHVRRILLSFVPSMLANIQVKIALEHLVAERQPLPGTSVAHPEMAPPRDLAPHVRGESLHGHPHVARTAAAPVAA